MTDYGQEIRKLSDEYKRLTGVDAFAHVSGSSYSFDTGYLHSGAEALGYMRERLGAAKAGQPEPCIARPGEPCLHTPQHTTRRTWAAYGSREAAGSAVTCMQATATSADKLTYRDKPAGAYDHDVVPGFSPVTWGDLRGEPAQIHPVHAQALAEIQRLTAEFAALGVKSPFEEYNGYYLFTDARMPSAPHALAHMRGLLAQAQREHGVSVLGPAAEVRHDGKTEARFPGEDTTQNANDAWTYILKHQSQSVDWAMRYEGWTIVEVAPDGTETVQAGR